MFVQTDSLSKRYGRIEALCDCTLQAKVGEILGLLGPNGAGKTTLLRVLMGYLKPTSGRALVNGLDCYRQSVEVHRCTAYLPGEARLFPRLDGRETLLLFASLRSAAMFARALELAERLQLDLSRPVSQMSTGMRQKLALVVAFAPQTPLVVLDEPTSNLDPTTRREAGALVREARAQGQTILFSSHVLSEVEDTCDRVVVLRQGRLVDEVQVADVMRQHRIRARLTGQLSTPPAELAAGLHIEPGVDGTVTMIAAGDLSPLLGWLAQQPLARLQVEPVGLRAIYERHHPAGAA